MSDISKPAENQVELQEYLQSMDREFIAAQEKMANIKQGYLDLYTQLNQMLLGELQDKSIYLARRSGNLSMNVSSLYKDATTFMANVPGANSRLIDRQNEGMFRFARQSLIRFFKFFWSMRKIIIP